MRPGSSQLVMIALAAFLGGCGLFADDGAPREQPASSVLPSESLPERSVRGDPASLPGDAAEHPLGTTWITQPATTAAPPSTGAGSTAPETTLVGSTGVATTVVGATNGLASSTSLPPSTGPTSPSPAPTSGSPPVPSTGTPPPPSGRGGTTAVSSPSTVRLGAPTTGLGAIPLPTRPTSTSTTVPNRPPQITLAAEILVDVGSSVSFAADVEDPDGDRVDLRYGSLPRGAELRPGNIVRFEPERPGRWQVTAWAVDRAGAFAVATTTLVARTADSPLVVMGMGDSVPAGNGLDINDYFRNDRCYRGEGLSYPYRVFDRLVAAGRLGDPGSARFVLAACSGHTTSHVLEREVTAPGSGSDLQRTQMDWARTLNPTLIMLTIGANDTEFDTPTVLADADGRLVESAVASRIATIDRNLPIILDRLLAETGAKIVVTTYHNPASQNANGLGSCTGVCFWEQAEEVVGRINASIVAAVAEVNSPRVVLADVYPLFEGRGAPNGLFPDAIRQDGSFLGDFLSQYTDPIHPYCAQNLGNFGTWVNAVDCVHPTPRGHDAYADEVIEVMDDAGFLR